MNDSPPETLTNFRGRVFQTSYVKIEERLKIEVRFVKTLYIHCLPLETRVVLTENRKPVEYVIQRNLEQQMVGNIYKGEVTDVLPGMQAAFVDIGLDKNAFLYVDEIYPSLEINRDKEELPPIRELVQEGQQIIVQIMKEAVGQKGPKVTTNITLPGRYLVYMPYGKHVGISRKIESEEERERLKEIGGHFVQESEGLIIRTVCEGIDGEVLQKDFYSLRKRWSEIIDGAELIQPKSLVYQEQDIIAKIVRDKMTEEINECVIDHFGQYQRLRQELDSLPRLKEKVTYYDGEQNLFDYYQLSTELERALRRKVWLKNGGYLIIDETEALTSIDVNTGKFTGKQNLEATVLQTNLEAAKEIARQLRLRDIGGIIIIDFIDMIEDEHQEQVLKQLELAVKEDRTKSIVVGLTSLGLVEMTRKKARQSLLETLTKHCPYCDGNGYVLSEESVAEKIEQSLIEYRTQNIEAMVVEAHPVVVKYFLQNERMILNRLEKECHFKVLLFGNQETHREEYRIVYAGEINRAYEKLELLKQQQ